MADEMISVTEIVKSKRGRKAKFDSNLLKVLKGVAAGKAVRLSTTFGAVPAADRPTVSAEIRKHWAKVQSDKPSIDYTPEGVPQVSHARRKVTR